jgi:hypothetical protein
MPSDVLSIVTAEIPETAAKKGATKDVDRGRVTDAIKSVFVHRTEIKADVLAARLKEFLDTMNNVMKDVPENLGTYKVDAMTLSVEVSAKGTVSLVGTGVELAGKGGLTFTLKRS